MTTLFDPLHDASLAQGDLIAKLSGDNPVVAEAQEKAAAVQALLMLRNDLNTTYTGDPSAPSTAKSYIDPNLDLFALIKDPDILRQEVEDYAKKDPYNWSDETFSERLAKKRKIVNARVGINDKDVPGFSTILTRFLDKELVSGVLHVQVGVRIFNLLADPSLDYPETKANQKFDPPILFDASQKLNKLLGARGTDAFPKTQEEMVPYEGAGFSSIRSGLDLIEKHDPDLAKRIRSGFSSLPAPESLWRRAARAVADRAAVVGTKVAPVASATQAGLVSLWKKAADVATRRPGLTQFVFGAGAGYVARTALVCVFGLTPFAPLAAGALVGGTMAAIKAYKDLEGVKSKRGRTFAKAVVIGASLGCLGGWIGSVGADAFPAVVNDVFATKAAAASGFDVLPSSTPIAETSVVAPSLSSVSPQVVTGTSGAVVAAPSGGLSVHELARVQDLSSASRCGINGFSDANGNGIGDMAEFLMRTGRSGYADGLTIQAGVPTHVDYTGGDGLTRSITMKAARALAGLRA